MSNLRDFFLQLETSLASGVTLARTLHLLSENVSGFGMKAKVAKMAKEVDKGMAFSTAMERAGKPFTGMQVSFAKFGEQTGTLPEVCGTLAEYADKEMNLEREILSSMAYPLFLLFLALMMLPILESVLAKGTAPSIPWGIARSVGIYAVILAGLYGVYKLLSTSGVASILVQIPFFGTIVKKLALCRFTRTLGVGLQAGVSMGQCLETSISVTSNAWLEKEQSSLKSSIQRGGSLADGFKSVNALPSTIKEMITVGEQSGKLPEMLKKTSDFLEDDARHKIQVISKLLPILFFLPIAGFVGYIIISMGSSIFSGLDSIK
jgi:type II secretory pathway component PulF